MAKFNTVLFSKEGSWESYFRLNGLDKDGLSELNRHIDFPHIMALTKTKLLVGKGYSFITKDKKLKAFWEKLEKDCRFQQKLGYVAYQVFMNGRAVVGFDRLLDGSYRIFVASNAFRPYIYKSYEDVISVYFWKEVQISQMRKLYIQESWNKKRVERVYTFDPNNLTNINIDVDVPKEHILPTSEPNRFAPAIPFHDFNNYEFSDKPDWWGVRNYIQKFNRLIDLLYRELKINRSRLVVTTTKKSSEDIQKQLKSNELDYLISVISGGSMDKPPVQKIDINLPFSDIQSMISSTLTEIFFGSDMSYNAFTSGGGNESTATETNLNNSGMNKSVEMSLTSMNADWKLLFIKIFKAEGFENPEFEFAIKDNTPLTEKEMVEIVISRFTNGFITRSDGLARLDNLTTEEAELKAEEIQKEEDERRQAELDEQMSIADGFNKNNDSNQPPPAVKKNEKPL